MGPLEELLDRMLPYYFYADRFGWDRATVDRQGDLYLLAMRMTANAHLEVQDSQGRDGLPRLPHDHDQ